MALLNSIAGGGGNIKLAPDLTFPSSLANASAIKSVSLNPSTGLITALSLTGKFVVDTLLFVGMTVETVTIKLTVDGVVIWNDTFTAATTLYLLSQQSSTGSLPGSSSSFTCDSSFLLEIQTATDTSVFLEYLARPIL